MPNSSDDIISLQVAERWCALRGPDWTLIDTAGRGGTAPVYSIKSPDGERALKLFDIEYSLGDKRVETKKRLELQLKLGVHECPYLVKFYDGGEFEDRLFLLMSKAPGQELAKHLHEVPRSCIRTIIDQIARACLYLRAHELCHRDIKSANIFVTDNFENAVLLDLSVARHLSDPIGIGTDHDGKLPVVSTSRYCPPEYLFRLVDASDALWHALDVYQLGGLLYDLIMRRPMFQVEKDSDNRYRFAWIVATVDPRIEADDVDSDLLYLARRSLDKDWRRRSTLTVEDFFDRAESRRSVALRTLGVSTKAAAGSTESQLPSLHKAVSDAASAIENGLRARLRSQGITAKHETKWQDLDSWSATAVLSWSSAPSDQGGSGSNVVLKIDLRAHRVDGIIRYDTQVRLSASLSEVVHEVRIELPSTAEEPTAEFAYHGFEEAAARLMDANATRVGT